MQSIHTYKCSLRVCVGVYIDMCVGVYIDIHLHICVTPSRTEITFIPLRCEIIFIPLRRQDTLLHRGVTPLVDAKSLIRNATRRIVLRLNPLKASSRRVDTGRIHLTAK